MVIAQTPRLILRHVTLYDAAFLLDLMNQPSYHRFIGDRGVRDVPGALNYIQTRFIDNYERLGYGLYAAELHGAPSPAGICGLVKRDTLPGPDLGFAFLPAYWSQGLAREAAVATLHYAKQSLGLLKLLAVTSLDNEASIRLLQGIG
ncbi:MAG: GNAT family N-acetyltransferase, partial [Pseudobdellovibrionaceae bacterium]|nr:GNAT family N-acetyltransferase [Pseudobdellovibrionaceae bacterium]